MIIDKMPFNAPFGGYSRTRIVFGQGVLNQLGSLVASLGNRALLVTSGSSVKTGLVSRCMGLLRKAHIDAIGYHEVHSNPTVHHVNAAVALAREHECNVLIAIGGGSPLDAAKAASVVINTDGQAEDMLIGGIQLPEKSMSTIAIPTTAGTGAELSQGAIICYPEKQLKGGIRGTIIQPNIALVDPTLTLTLPAKQIKVTGFDALSHAIETYISNIATPITAIYSQNAIFGIANYLPQILDNPSAIEPRYYMSLYSMLMGYNLANSSTCIPHRLQYPLGMATNTDHALGLAALYPTWIRITRNSSPEKFNDVARLIAGGLGIGQDVTIEKAIGEFLATIDLTPTLRTLGVDENLCHELASKVNGTLKHDPWWNDGNDLTQFYLEAL